MIAEALEWLWARGNEAEPHQIIGPENNRVVLNDTGVDSVATEAIRRAQPTPVSGRVKDTVLSLTGLWAYFGHHGHDANTTCYVGEDQVLVILDDIPTGDMSWRARRVLMQLDLSAPFRLWSGGRTLPPVDFAELIDTRSHEIQPGPTGDAATAQQILEQVETLTVSDDKNWHHKRTPTGVTIKTTQNLVATLPKDLWVAVPVYACCPDVVYPMRIRLSCVRRDGQLRIKLTPMAHDRTLMQARTGLLVKLREALPDTIAIIEGVPGEIQVL